MKLKHLGLLNNNWEIKKNWIFQKKHKKSKKNKNQNNKMKKVMDQKMMINKTNNKI